MKFRKINNPNYGDFKEIWNIYKSSFPSDERRDLKQQLALFKNKRYSFFGVYENTSLVAVITVWNLNSCIFIEHMAVKKNLIGKGIGKKLLKKFISKYKKKIVLEVKRPGSEINRKRISFYEQAAFKLNKYDYIQPPYAKNKSLVPMFLMTYPNKINENDFSEIREKIHTIVYGCKKAIIH